MSQTAILIIQVLAFLAVILAIEGAYLLMRSSNRRERAVNRRMKMAAERGESVLNPDLFRKKIEGGSLSALLSGALPSLGALAWRSALGVTTGQVLAIMGGAALLFVLLFTGPLGLGLLPGAFAGVIFGGGLPIAILNFAAGRRQRKFGEQLPVAIDIMVRGLQAGHPAPVAMEMVARELEDPIGSEFGLALDEMNYGLERSVALRNIAHRFPLPEFRFFVSSVEMQKETGGNLAEILGNLSKVIRERSTMRKKIWAMSAEGRMTCFIVGGLPFVVTAAIFAINKEFFLDVAPDPMFLPMIGMGFILWVIGIVWIWKMVNFKF